jgi:phage tail-like protein
MIAARIEQLLPGVVRRTRLPGSVLDTMLQVMEHLHQPVESVLADFPAYVDPYRCPPQFVPFLAEWTGLGWLTTVGADGQRSAPSGDGPLRDLVAEAASLARHRGTVHGLTRSLALATGCDDIRVVTPADRAFHVLVTAPEVARPWTGLMTRIIRHDKPAFVTAELQIGDTPPVALGPRRNNTTSRQE